MNTILSHREMHTLADVCLHCLLGWDLMQMGQQVKAELWNLLCVWIWSHPEATTDRTTLFVSRHATEILSVCTCSSLIYSSCFLQKTLTVENTQCPIPFNPLHLKHHLTTPSSLCPISEPPAYCPMSSSGMNAQYELYKEDSSVAGFS